MYQALRSPGFEPATTAIGRAGSEALELHEDAAALIRMGAFSCDLASNRLTWTRGVFDLFGLPDDRAPEREAIVAMYDEESLALLERKRSRAIETGSGFSLDARISGANGLDRWIRITAATKSSNGRAHTLYGMKQDITADRERWELLRAQAECDPLTGVGNRALFQRFLEAPKGPSPLGRIGALVLFDMNRFKHTNDRWGHAAGDACLAAFGRRLVEAFPHARLIARIGGDEFAVLLAPPLDRDGAQAAVRSVIGRLFSPLEWHGDLLPISASMGLALPAGQAELDPQQLFLEADWALYEAKDNASTSIIACA